MLSISPADTRLLKVSGAAGLAFVPGATERIVNTCRPVAERGVRRRQQAVGHRCSERWRAVVGKKRGPDDRRLQRRVGLARTIAGLSRTTLTMRETAIDTHCGGDSARHLYRHGTGGRHSGEWRTRQHGYEETSQERMTRLAEKSTCRHI